MNKMKMTATLMTILYLASITGIACQVSAPPPSPSNVWVNDDFDPSTPGWGVTRFDEIQDGIENVADYGTVHVAAGMYVENIVIDKSLILVGAGSDMTTIDGNNVGNTVTITASDVTLSGFTITGGICVNIFAPFGGVVIDGTGGTSALTGITIEDNIIQGNYGNGIYVSAAGHGGGDDNIVIRNNEVSNNGIQEASSAGISLTYVLYTGYEEPWEEWRRPKNILVEGNDVHENYWYGIYLNSGKNCVIRSNEIWGNLKKGLLLASSMTRTEIPSEYNTVEHNEIYGNLQNGIKTVCYNHHNTFTANVIYGNGYGATADYFGYGFQFKDGDHNTLQNNIITGNALGGLYLWGHGDPSYTWYGTTDNIIIGNTISDHTGHGIYIPDRSYKTIPGWPDGYPNSGFLNSHINYNNIMGNSFGLENQDTTQTIDAELNWWGDPSGPSGVGSGSGDTVSDYVDFDPWIIGFEGLSDEVQALDLPTGIENSLVAKLDAALKAFNDGKYDVSINLLYTFINAVMAQKDKKIPGGDADLLIESAEVLIDYISTFL